MSVRFRSFRAGVRHRRTDMESQGPPRRIWHALGRPACHQEPHIWHGGTPWGNMYSCKVPNIPEACLEGSEHGLKSELVSLLSATTPRPPRIRSIPRSLHPSLAVDVVSFVLAVCEDEIMNRDIQLSVDQAEEQERDGGASRSYSS